MFMIAFKGSQGAGDVTRIVGPFQSSDDAGNFLDRLGWTVRGVGRPNVRVNFEKSASEVSAHIKKVESPK